MQLSYWITPDDLQRERRMKSTMWLLLAGALVGGAALPVNAAPLGSHALKMAGEDADAMRVGYRYHRHSRHWHYPRYSHRYYRYYDEPYYYGYYPPYYRSYYYRPYRHYYGGYGPSFGIYFGGHRGWRGHW
jgi:hypothetical protein